MEKSQLSKQVEDLKQSLSEESESLNLLAKRIRDMDIEFNSLDDENDDVIDMCNALYDEMTKKN